MENVCFSMQNSSLRAKKLSRVIRSKISDVSDSNIKNIVGFIDIDKQHYVKATRNPRRFLNIVTGEDVCASGKCFKSHSEMIYGFCNPGTFVEKHGFRFHTEGWLDSGHPAAAVKSIVSCDGDLIDKTEHMLVIYEPAAVV